MNSIENFQSIKTVELLIKLHYVYLFGLKNLACLLFEIQIRPAASLMMDQAEYKQ